MCATKCCCMSTEPVNGVCNLCLSFVVAAIESTLIVRLPGIIGKHLIGISVTADYCIILSIMFTLLMSDLYDIIFRLNSDLFLSSVPMILTDKNVPLLWTMRVHV